jgi:hypothetical protein
MYAKTGTTGDLLAGIPISEFCASLVGGEATDANSQATLL